jgi:peptide/nickel transport system substrate-binding protein
MTTPAAALDGRRQPAVALNILSTPIASIVDEKQVAANVKDNDFGNAG